MKTIEEHFNAMLSEVNSIHSDGYVKGGDAMLILHDLEKKIHEARVIFERQIE